MNEYIIQKYINKLTLNNINEFAKKEGIILESYETNIIYEFIKDNWKEIYHKNDVKLLNKLKDDIKPQTYNKVIEIFEKYKKTLN